jgi:hypothetical protein
MDIGLDLFGGYSTPEPINSIDRDFEKKIVMDRIQALRVFARPGASAPPRHDRLLVGLAVAHSESEVVSNAAVAG